MLLNKAIILALASAVFANEADRATITRAPFTTLVPTYVPGGGEPGDNPELVFIGGDSDGEIYIDEDNVSYLDDSDDSDTVEEDHEFIDIVYEEDDVEYNEDGLHIEFDESDLSRDHRKTEEKKDVLEWDEQAAKWKKKCCSVIYKCMTETKVIKQKPRTKMIYRTRFKTMITTAIKTAYKTISKTYRGLPETKNVKVPVTQSKTVRLPPVTTTKFLQKEPITESQYIPKEYTITKTYENEYTTTKTCTETIKPTKQCKEKEDC